MKTDKKNKEIVLASHPSGLPNKENFRLNDIEMPQIKEGEVLLKSLYVSVDPGMRGFMDKGDDDAAGLKFKLNMPISSRTVARIIESKNNSFPEGTIVQGRLAWQKYQSLQPDTLVKVDSKLAPISTAVSILGVPGLAAYFGMLKIGNPKKGETAVISGAAGAVGSVAAQIAKLQGCKVIGIAGSVKKITYLEQELGIDKGINYKETADMQEAIRKFCPDGVDIFFDNVGGELFDAVFANISKNARIVICGQIAEYNESNPPRGPRPMHFLIKKSARMEGFVVFDFKEEFDIAKKELWEWYNSGKLKYRENLIEGFEKLPDAFIGLFNGENIGKQLVKVEDVNT